MIVRKGHSATDSANKREVGEIDTRAPFQSVKDAVSLFGKVALSRGKKPAVKNAKPNPSSEVFFTSRVLAKKMQLHLVQKEINKSKEQLKNAEITKSQALSELEKAIRTVDDLNLKLKNVTEFKDSAIKATEAAKLQAEQILEAKNGVRPESDGSSEEHVLEKIRQQYKTAMSELNTAKQELGKLRRDRDNSLEAKLSAIKQSTEAENTAKSYSEKVDEISKEISAVHESIGQVKLVALQAQQDHAKVFSEKDVMKHSYKAMLEESTKKLVALKNQFDPEVIKDLEGQLAETSNEIEDLQRQTKNYKTSDLDSVKVVTAELDGAKELLQKEAEEEKSLKSVLESLKLELEKTKKQRTELEEKDAETESIASNLHIKLHKSKSDLEACLAEESKTRCRAKETITTIQQLSSETKIALQEAEETKNKAKELKNEAEAMRITLLEAERKLKVAIEETHVAKVAEAKALGQISALSERTNSARALTAESCAKITLSRDELESLNRKVEESNKLTNMKVAAAMAQVGAVRASKNEVLQKLETTQKEIDDMKSATLEALRRADMAEAARSIVEGELLRWHQKEQTKATSEAASLILAEKQVLLTEPSAHEYLVHQQSPIEQIIKSPKLEKKKTLSPKNIHLPKIGVGGIFHRKKNQIDGGTLSYLPGENPM
ncbi:hypothetical protein ACFE04_023541 [Oxalis oulophora]